MTDGGYEISFNLTHLAIHAKGGNLMQYMFSLGSELAYFIIEIYKPIAFDMGGLRSV